MVIGREAWLDRGAYIGGGSAFDPQAELVVGDWLHMGRNSHINCARPVSIGHEFGCGVETKVFAHGAYLSELAGFPVQFAGVTIGDRVWLPNAWVNPGVTIGSDVVVAARSLVNRDLPSGLPGGRHPGQGAAGALPIPQPTPRAEQCAIVERIIDEAVAILQPRHVSMTLDSGKLMVYVRAGNEGDTEVFDLDARAIYGPVSAFGRVFKNQLRRHGIRFPLQRS